MNVYEALRTRRSIRKFHSTPVSEVTVRRIISGALSAPSGSNIQPWKVYAVAGAARAALVEDLLSTARAGSWEGRATEYQYYPKQWFEPYLSRRRKVGFDLYKAVGIGKEDHARRLEQALENFTFFGAPVGLFITFDRRLEAGTYLDVGMFIQSLMMGAREEGLDTCGQAIFCWLHEVVRRHVPIPENELLACGMSLGYADLDAPVNRFAVDKLSVDDVAHFQGF